jgi:hypothetical protein
VRSTIVVLRGMARRTMSVVPEEYKSVPSD